MGSSKRKITILLGLGGLLTLIGCRSPPTQPEPSEKIITIIEKKPIHERLDTEDALWTADVTATKFAELQKSYPLNIVPDTLSTQGITYILGGLLKERGIEVTEITEYKRVNGKIDSTTVRQINELAFDREDLQQRLNLIVNGYPTRENLPLGIGHPADPAGYIVDVPNVPYTETLGSRLKGMNQGAAGKVIFRPVYLRGRDNTIVRSPARAGYSVIDGIEIIPVQDSAGYTGTDNHAIYIATGDENFLKLPIKR